MVLAWSGATTAFVRPGAKQNCENEGILNEKRRKLYPEIKKPDSDFDFTRRARGRPCETCPRGRALSKSRIHHFTKNAGEDKNVSRKGSAGGGITYQKEKGQWDSLFKLGILTELSSMPNR